MEEHNSGHQAERGSHHYRVRMPGFIVEEDIGLGDVIRHINYRIGIKTCGGCERRAAVLNQWLVFTRRLARH